MKTTGALILVIGLVITVFTTYGVLEGLVIGTNLMRMTPNVVHFQIWEPLLGAIVVMIGTLIATSHRRGRAILPN
jgi:hypothetical protein